MKLITAVDNVEPGTIVEGLNGELVFIDSTGEAYVIKGGKRNPAGLAIDVKVFADIEQMIDPYEAIFI